LLIAIAIQACSLAGCGTINERVAAGVSDVIPAWAAARLQTYRGRYGEI
jgi:hypothetical protein